ncbi:Uncharacterized protein Adt_39298 [Abeliophyllum distichum]|uniref:Uncharacterized protein n=1 Tax=Abeliophyllum distichum TaxID=126358 RepID=A0ABD1Q4P2_9LAMI
MSGEDVSRTPLENTPSRPLCKCRGQGPTRGKQIEKIVAACGHKLKVDFNTLNGRAIGPNTSGWANEMGFIIHSMAPLVAKQWKEIDHAYKIPTIDHLKSMKKMWSEYRCKLHKYFVSVGGNEDVGLAKRRFTKQT